MNSVRFGLLDPISKQAPEAYDRLVRHDGHRFQQHVREQLALAGNREETAQVDEVVAKARLANEFYTEVDEHRETGGPTPRGNWYAAYMETSGALQQSLAHAVKGLSLAGVVSALHKLDEAPELLKIHVTTPLHNRLTDLVKAGGEDLHDWRLDAQA